MRRALLVFVLTAQSLAAAPDFSTSTIRASRSAITPLETIEYTVVVRNTGDSAPSYLRIGNRISNSAMYVSSSPDWVVDDESREMTWSGTIEPGQSKELRLTLVTRRDSAGLTLANRTEIHYDGLYHGIDHDLQIDSKPTPGGITTAGKVVFGYIGLAILASIVIAMLARRVSYVFLSGLAGIFISIGFLLFFVDLARRDLRMKRDFLATQCTVVDSLARYTVSADTGSSKSRTRSGTWSPEFAVRYPTSAGEVVSIGYQSESALQFGSSKRTVDALASLPRGGKAPCWYDPADPQRVVLSRAAGGAYGFALIPLIGLVFAGFLIRRG